MNGMDKRPQVLWFILKFCADLNNNNMEAKLLVLFTSWVDATFVFSKPLCAFCRGGCPYVVCALKFASFTFSFGGFCSTIKCVVCFRDDFCFKTII